MYKISGTDKYLARAGKLSLDLITRNYYTNQAL